VPVGLTGSQQHDPPLNPQQGEKERRRWTEALIPGSNKEGLHGHHIIAIPGHLTPPALETRTGEGWFVSKRANGI